MPTSSYTFQILLEGKDAIAAAKKIRAELQRELSQGIDLRQQMAAVDAQAQTTAQRMALMTQELQQATREGGRLEVDLRDADDATRGLVSSLLQSGASAAQLENALSGGKVQVEETRKAVKWLGRDLQEVSQMGRLDRFGAALSAATRQTYGMRMLSSELSRLGTGLMVTGAAIVGPEILAGKRWIEYTRDVSHSARAMGLAREESELLRQELIEQSQALALFSPEEMAEGLWLWSTGVGATASNQAELNKVIQDTIPIQQLAYMHNIDLATAMEATAGILGEYGLATSETQRVTEILNATADRTFATVGDLGSAFKMVGPVANQLGVSVSETAAAFGILSDANIKGSMAGRAMRQLFIRLTKTTKEEDEALNELFKRSEALGQSWRDLAFPEGEFVGLARWIDLLAASTETLTQEERAAALATISTANELPALTQLVERQINAREQGINILRAEEKILRGTLDSETEAYARWEESITGNIMGLESAHDGFARKVQQTTEEEGYQIDQLKQKWNALMLTMGEATTELALPALEKLDALLDDITEYAAAHPEVVQAAGVAGALLTGIGAFIKTASVGVRLYADWQMIGAAATMLAASENMLAAAGIQQAATGGRLLGGLGGLGGLLGPIAGYTLAAYGGLEIGSRVVSQVRGETVTIRDALGEIWGYAREAGALVAGTGGMLTAALLGEDPAEAFEIATYEAGRLLGLIEDDMKPAAEDTGDELRDWNVELERARRQAAGLGTDLAQLPDVSTGLVIFTEAEFEALDELWDYFQRRNEMIKENNEELAEMEANFLEREEEYYRDYIDKRQDLEEELQQVIQDPLWQMSRDVQKAEKRIQEAIEDYNKRVREAIEDHQKKLRNLQEDHDDHMEDLEARRDAKGILAERRRYRRSVRDAQETHQDLLDDLKDRLDETVKSEHEKLEETRKERKEDLEEKLRELDKNYQEEEQKRLRAHQKALADKQEQQQKELQQLHRAYVERIARIIGWEEQIRNELRRGYIQQYEDLRRHLDEMRAEYASYYDMIATMAMTPEEVRAYHEQVRGHQMGGYAGAGLYRLGEAGREFVLSSPTTQAMERAIGYLTQGKLLGLTTGGGYFKLDINVRADQHFSPDFAPQIEAQVRKEIVGLAGHVTRSARPGAYRAP